MTSPSSRLSSQRLPISVVILTRNEEAVVADAIASVIEDFEEVVVLDSLSDDQTVELARSVGARVVQNQFAGYASQRNYALRVMDRSTEWVLFLDADERVSPALIAELHHDFADYSANGVGLLYIRRKDFFMGRWIRHSSGYPTWFGRLCHATSVRVEREINEQYQCDRPSARLAGHLLHYPFAKGLDRWVERHNEYSTAEAKTLLATKKTRGWLVLSRDPPARRQGLKQIYMRLPFRPLLGFVFLYVLKGGFLDGKPGLRYAMLRAFYELLISIKLDELRAKSHQSERQLPKSS